ncbi:hypothetical protein BD626DRAFT_366701, partial [Schizophyllum amplum]
MPDLLLTLFPDEAFPIRPAILLEAMPENIYHGGRWKNCPDLSKQSMESQTARFFNEIVHYARLVYKRTPGKDLPTNEERRWSAKYIDRIMPGGTTSRKPDLFLKVRNDKSLWKSVLVGGQLKSEEHAFAATERQLQDDAYNCFATQDDLMWHIEVGLVCEEFWLSVFDRSGCVHSARGNIHEDALSFLRILAGLAFLERSRLGYDSSIKTLPDGRRTMEVDGVVYEIIGMLFLSDVMRGRGTVCWHCRALDAGPEDEDVVIKSLWADQSRAHTEAEFLRAAEGVEGISTLVAEEIVTEGDPPRARSTATIRRALRNHGREAELVGIEERHQYRLVLKPYALHIENFSSKKELLSVLKDAIKAHEQLVYDRRILHSDISDNNVMIRADPPGGLRKGLLIDLDYAAFIGEQRDTTSTAHRTGTLPFMAWEILKYGDKIAHEPRHDLESFLYVLIVVCVCHSGPNRQYRQDFDLRKSRIGRWMELDEYMSDIGSAKEAVMCLPKDGLPDEFQAFIDELFDPYFEDLKPCVHELREVILGPAPSNPRAMHREVLGILQRYI